MFVGSNFLMAVAEVLNLVLTLYMWIIIAAAVISWVQPNPYNPIVRFLYRATDPVLAWVRRYLPPMGGLDFSPLVVILAILFLKKFLVASLVDAARRMK
jgi:YggT family protein